jgi:hypothetical protein
VFQLEKLCGIERASYIYDDDDNELNDLYCSPNIIRMIKSRRMRWARQVACMGKSRGAHRLWCKNLKKKDHFEYLDVDGRIILKCILKDLFACVDWIDLS